MDSIDPNVAQRVWQRVSGCGTCPDVAAMTALMAQELSDAAVLTRLSKQVGGRGGDLLRLAKQCRQNAGCLRGIRTMTQPNCPDPAIPIPSVNTPSAALRRCYVNFLHRIHTYEAAGDDPDFGLVFRNLGEATRRQCPTLLDLMGKIER